MAALSTGTRRRKRNVGGAGPKFGHFAVKTAAIVYQGGLVNITAGRIVAAAAAVNSKCLGVCQETKTGNTGGTVTARVEWDAEWAFDPNTALTKAFTGANCGVSTDNDVTTVTGAGTALVRVRVGQMTQWVSTTECWVHVRNFSESDISTSG